MPRRKISALDVLLLQHDIANTDYKLHMWSFVICNKCILRETKKLFFAVCRIDM